MKPIADGHGEWTCSTCGQFFLDETWSYCPICGEKIEWIIKYHPDITDLAWDIGQEEKA